ncbi:MAG: hypothetical protein FWF54_04540 [Candidatus Azobacteroides sp.]|nr:hypothetical protein [Candidatus Azobacteroides sp.]
MKHYCPIIILLISLISCKTQKMIEVPVKESERITERLVPVVLSPDSALFDAFLACDSLNNVYIRQLSETRTQGITGNWQMEDNRLVYKTIVKRDTVYLPQTEKERYVEVPVKVEVIKEVNVLTGWQNFQVWMGRFALAAAGISVGFMLIRSKLK